MGIALEQIEIKLLLEGIYQHYGYDLRNYSLAFLQRRIWHRIHIEKLTSISALQEKVLHDPGVMEKLLADIAIPVTEMFRNPSFFRAVRAELLPLLHKHPHVRIWLAGCATGEEAYSLAVFLHEEGLYEKTTIYATDMQEEFLNRAKQGVFTLERMQLYTKNYLQAGGTRAFSEYYTAGQERVAFHPFLSRNIVFAQHNLVTDQSFNEFQVIFCRNVLIYFDKQLQNHVHKLFYESLCPDGVLGLGHREGVKFTSYGNYYQEFYPGEKLYRKIR